MKEIEKELTAIKFKAFGKVKINNKGELEKIICEKEMLLKDASKQAEQKDIEEKDANILRKTF